MPGIHESTSTAVAIMAAAADLVIVTLAVAWALEEIIYFSLFVGIPAGIASAVVTYVLLRKLLKNM